MTGTKDKTRENESKRRSCQVFFEHASCPGNAHGFLNSPVPMGGFGCPNFLIKLFYLFPSGYWWSTVSTTYFG